MPEHCPLLLLLCTVLLECFVSIKHYYVNLTRVDQFINTIHTILARTQYRIACNFRGQNIRGWRSDHEYFTHEWSGLAYLYLQCKQQPWKYYPLNVSILLNQIFCPPKITRYTVVRSQRVNFIADLALSQSFSPAKYSSNNYSIYILHVWV